MSKIHIIPDVHGCLHELKELIEKLNIQSGDKVISLGDLIDKGPQSSEVVKYFRELGEKYDLTVVQGNHEEMFLKWLSRPEEKRIKMKTHEEYSNLNESLCDKDRDFLKKTVLYVQFSRKDRDYICVHGGIPQNILDEFPDLPSLEEVSTLSSRWRSRFSRMMRLRFQTEEGTFVSLGDETKNSVYWSDTYQGQYGFCFYGHNPWIKDGMNLQEHSWGLDGGCVNGVQLNGVTIHENGNMELVVVQSHKTYRVPKYID